MKIDILKHSYCWGYVYSIFAVEESRVVGTVEVEFVVDDRGNSYVEGLFVREDCRERGIGSVLLETAERLSLQDGRDIVHLDIEDGDDYARGFYIKRGYKATEKWQNQRGNYQSFEKRTEGEI